MVATTNLAFYATSTTMVTTANLAFYATAAANVPAKRTARSKR